MELGEIHYTQTYSIFLLFDGRLFCNLMKHSGKRALFRFNMIQPQLIKVVTKHISAPRWLKWSTMLPQWLFWRLTAREPVYVHKISAAFTLPELSQAERVAPVPDPTGYFRNFLIWARYLFISNPFSLMSMSVAVRTKTLHSQPL